MKHPLEFIPLNLRKPLFYVFFAMTIAIFGIFNILDQPLQRELGGKTSRRILVGTY